MRILVLVCLTTGLSGQSRPASHHPEPPAQLSWPDGWKRQEVGVGLEWWQRHCQLFGAPQNLNVLLIDPEQVRCDVVRPDRGRQRTSGLARKHDAIAAVNGGYFKRNGAPVGLLQIDGKVHGPAPARGQGALGFAVDGSLRIGKPRQGGWPAVHDGLGAGPLLIAAGKDIAPRQKRSHYADRHPRTAAGLTRSGKLLLLTLDGRSKGNAAGLTLAELAQVMLRLGCQEGVNLDGGGSTTMWLSGRGVVNRPSDNKQFDAAGERAVGNAVVLRGRMVKVLDDDAARLHGEGWRQVTEGAGFLGKDYALLGDGKGARAVWSVTGLRPGRYELFLRVPATGKHRNYSGRLGSGAAFLFSSGDRPSWQACGMVTLAKDRMLVEVVGTPGKPLLLDGARLVERKSGQR